MITLVQSFISQINLFLFCAIILIVDRMIDRDTRSLGEMIPEPFDNVYFTSFMLIVWFVGLTYFRYYFQIPEWGIWSYIWERREGRILLAFIIIVDLYKFFILNRRK